jgi:hypothetical protein
MRIICLIAFGVGITVPESTETLAAKRQGPEIILFIVLPPRKRSLSAHA